MPDIIGGPFGARDERCSESVRERIRLRLPAAQREMFDAVMSWEDDMLAWCNELAERLDKLTEAVMEERRWATGTAEHNDARTALYALISDDFAASNHEAVGAGNQKSQESVASGATEAGVTPGGRRCDGESASRPPRVATDARSGSGDLAATLAPIGVVRDLGEIESDLRADVLKCCDGREQFCEAYGCSTIERIADRIGDARRAAMEATDA